MLVHLATQGHLLIQAFTQLLGQQRDEAIVALGVLGRRREDVFGPADAVHRASNEEHRPAAVAARILDDLEGDVGTRPERANVLYQSLLERLVRVHRRDDADIKALDFKRLREDERRRRHKRELVALGYRMELEPDRASGQRPQTPAASLELSFDRHPKPLLQRRRQYLVKVFVAR